MSFPQKVKSILWGIVDAMACNTASFVKDPGKDFTRQRRLGFAQLGKWEYQVNLSMAIKICFAFLQDQVAPGNVNSLIG